MYKEQKLRVGNWIEVYMADSNRNKHYGIVEEVGDNYNHLKVYLKESDETITILPDVVNPPVKFIPFTKEILLKNQSVFVTFTRDRGVILDNRANIYTDDDIYNSHSLDIKFQNNGNLQVLYKKERDKDIWMLLRVDSQQLSPFTFVHELQNLYSELSGNELKIVL